MPRPRLTAAQAAVVRWLRRFADRMDPAPQSDPGASLDSVLAAREAAWRPGPSTDTGFRTPRPVLVPGAPGLTCGAQVNGVWCKRPADYHACYDADGTNVLYCAAHLDQAALGSHPAEWAKVIVHRYDPLCSMPGAVFHRDRCTAELHDLPVKRHPTDRA